MSARRVGNVIGIVSEEIGPLEGAPGGCDDGTQDGMVGPCIETRATITVYVDAATGKRLLTLDEHTSHEKHDLKGSKLRRTGPTPPGSPRPGSPGLR